ncbi:MAG TPA: UDP-N-acetylmuramoyl-L-alanine--D-glutamate ligase [bacterium]|nr:UDP-N-acetylmuramoyl-L-alanine--D-glutamate ligase [bacterium]HNL26105.1 UDP-N-acetylmuramoyl-L-alanine--D-glutamate ligase [bacterium]
MRDVKGKKITVIGAASSGIAAARLLKHKGASVFVSEFASEEKKNEAKVLLQNEHIACEFGGHTERATDCDWAVVSPGVPSDIPVLQTLHARNIPVYSEVEIASWWIPAPVVAITGSNGKTTTTTLIGELFKHAGRTTVVAGNIGTPLSDCTETLPKDGVAVVEVSSFQAEGFESFHPQVGIMLNLSPDHLDRYSGVEAYYAAKKNMIKNQTASDVLVVNQDDATLMQLIGDSKAQRWAFSLQSIPENGAYVENDTLMVKINGKVEPVIATGDIGIIGRHNLYNAMAAILAAKALDVKTSVMAETLRSFRGVEHRLEFVAEKSGVRYYNDSKATNVDSTFVALDSFKKEKVILIAGGKHKGSPYTPLKTLVEARVKSLVLIGQAADIIAGDLGTVTRVQRAASMQEAVEISKQTATPGDVVLLSPACASYDMFKNYEDRGRQFKMAVEGLK